MTTRRARAVLLLLTGLFWAATGARAAAPDDPLGSTQWPSMYAAFLDDGREVVFDDRVRVRAPGAAEDALAVPVMVDASAVPGVERMLVFADYNPIPRILEFHPDRVEPRLAFRFKIQQASPVRAAVLDADGVWRVGGVWIDAAGGGCTLPSMASADQAWASRLGEVHGRLWPRDEGPRLRFSVVHPMDTGLAVGIPAFHIEDLVLRDADGQALARLSLYEPVAENPTLSLDLRGGQNAVVLSGRDNNGNTFEAEITQ